MLLSRFFKTLNRATGLKLGADFGPSDFGRCSLGACALEMHDSTGPGIGAAVFNLCSRSGYSKLGNAEDVECIGVVRKSPAEGGGYPEALAILQIGKFTSDVYSVLRCLE